MESDCGAIMNYVKKTIDEWDPIGLLPHAPNDEYQAEIEEIQQLLETVNDSGELSKGIFFIFEKAFGKNVFFKSQNDCERIAGILISHKNSDTINS